MTTGENISSQILKSQEKVTIPVCSYYRITEPRMPFLDGPG